MPCVHRARSSAAAGALTCALLALVGAGCGNGEPGASASPKVATAGSTTATVSKQAAPAPKITAPIAATGGQTAGGDEVEGSNPLPEDSALALPPMIHLTAHGAFDAGPPSATTVRMVLRSKQLALSPAALRSIRAGKVLPGALDLLLRIRPAGSQLLVFAAGGPRLRVQARRWRPPAIS